MHNPWNPSVDDIRQWAYDLGALAPCQDWELALEWAQHERLYLDLASDESCPKWRFFLGVLYLMVGDAVRTQFRNQPRALIEAFIARGEDYTDLHIKHWQKRSRELLEHPEQFDYRKWCGFGFANET
jgi:hypothetical protein